MRYSGWGNSECWIGWAANSGRSEGATAEKANAVPSAVHRSFFSPDCRIRVRAVRPLCKSVMLRRSSAPARRHSGLSKTMITTPAGPPMLALIFPLLLFGEATAKVVSLACTGTIREIGKGRAPEEGREPRAFSLILDTKKRTVIVDDYDAIPLSEDTGSKNTVIFSGSPSPKPSLQASIGLLARRRSTFW
jgi:hypothetical protein